MGAFSLPTISSATPWSCLYLMPVAFLNRNAAAKHAFEKTYGRPTFPQFSFSTPCVMISGLIWSVHNWPRSMYTAKEKFENKTQNFVTD